MEHFEDFFGISGICCLLKMIQPLKLLKLLRSEGLVAYKMVAYKKSGNWKEYK